MQFLVAFLVQQLQVLPDDLGGWMIGPVGGLIDFQRPLMILLGKDEIRQRPQEQARIVKKMRRGCWIYASLLGMCSSCSHMRQQP